MQSLRSRILSPQDDPLSALLERYLPANQIPQRDLSGNYQGQTLDELIVRPLICPRRHDVRLTEHLMMQSARNWRAVARFCQDTIIHSSPRNTSHILQVSVRS